MDVDNLWILLLGGALVGLALWSWLGRSRAARWWVRTWEGDSLVLGILPGTGLVLFGLGLVAVFDGALQTVGSLLWLCGFPVFLIGFITPSWWGPAWYRQLSKPERRAAQTDALGTFARSRSTRLPEPSAERAARTFPSDSTPIATWRAGYVYDADTAERTHGLSRRGTIDGRLAVYSAGLVFAASRTEDGLRGSATVVTLPRDHLTDVRLVPARAGADGRPRRGILHRSLFPRLVVDTTHGSKVFEIAWGRAQQAATVVNQTLMGQRT